MDRLSIKETACEVRSPRRPRLERKLRRAELEAWPNGGSAEGDGAVATQEGAQGFYKVWVSDAPMEAE